MELLAKILVFFLELFRLTIGSLQCAHYTAHSRGNAKSETEQREPRSGAELLVEPLPAQKPDQNAEREFEPDRSIAPDIFPVLLHACRLAALA